MASKQKQRTKGNTRPSSSGRAAELLARDGSSGAGASGFIGFGTMSGDLGYVPAAQSPSLESDQDTSLEADFRMALRKLTKRDVVTKLKAIQEFGALCKEKDAESVKGTLPHWPRIYSRLATDHDKRVREATQQAFEQLVLRVRRNLAPQLRALMGTWLLSQCDTYAPAALSARAAFHSAFPVAKQGEAVAFCKMVVLRFLEDNLLKETPASLSDPKAYTPEEQEEKYLRILTSSLLALGEFVTVLPEKELPSVQDTLSSILEEGKLWKLSNKNSPQLRSAMYSLQGSFIKSAPSMAEAHLARISTTLLGSLDESDPLAVQSLWESMLLVVSTFPNCWTHLNIRKAVLPKLWSMLKNGGNGSATVIHPNLLPLLSHVPSDVTGTGVGFYKEFFGNIKEGLTCSSAQQSTSEYGAIVKAYMECLRYAIAQSISSNATDESRNVQTYLIQDQLMPLLSQSITEDNSRLVATNLYLQTSKLLSHLRKQFDKSPSARDVLNMIWTSLESLCTEQIDLAKVNENLSRSLEKISVLLTQLQSPSKPLRLKMMKKRTVSFSDDGSPGVTEPDPKSTPASSNEHPELICLIRKLVRNSFAPARSGSLSHLKFLVRILDCFQQAEVFEELLESDRKEEDSRPKMAEEREELEEGITGKRNDKDDSSEIEEDHLSEMRDRYSGITSVESEPSELACDNKNPESIIRRCFEDVLLPWVQSEEEKQCEKDVALRPKEEVLVLVVHIVEAAFRCCEDHQKTSLLDDFCRKTSKPQTLYLLVKKILHNSSSTCARSWLKSAPFGEKLLQLTDTLCSQALSGNTDSSSSQTWSLINLGLTVEEEEPAVDTGYAEQILCKFTDTLLRSKVIVEGNEQRVHSCISFICDMAANFFTAVKGCLLISSAEDLLLALFQLGCEEATNFPESLQQKIHLAWTKGAESLIRQTGGFLKEEGFLCKAAAWIKACLNQGPHSTHSIELLAKPAVTLNDLILSSLPPSADHDTPVIAECFLALLVPTEAEWDQCMDMPNQWMESLFLDEALTFTDLPETTLADPIAMPMGLVQSVFVAALLRPSETLASPEVEDKPLLAMDDLIEQEKEFDGCVATSQLPWRYDAIAPVLRRLLYALQWCKGTMGEDLAVEIPEQNLSVVVPLYCLEVAMVINGTLEATWKRLVIDDWKKLVYDVLEASMTAGNLWSSSLSYLLSCYTRYQGKQQKLDVLQMAQGLDRFAVLCPSLIHTLEGIIPHMNHEQTLDLLEINTAKLLSSSEKMVAHVDGGLGSMSVVAAIVRQQDSFDVASQSHIVASCIQELMQWREDYQDMFLFGCDFSVAVIFDDVFLNIKMMQLMRLAIERLPTALTEQTWDFVLCSVVAWIQTCSQNIEYALSSPLITTFCCMAFDLLTSAVTLLGDPTSNPSLPANLCTEWREFFSDTAFSLMLPLFVTIVESTDFDSLTIPRHCLLQSASDAVCHIPPEQIKKHTLSPTSASSDGAAKTSRLGQASGDSKAAQNALQTLLDCLCPMMLMTDRSAKLAAFQLLEKVMDEISRADEVCLKDESSEDKDKTEEESAIPPPEPLKEIIDSTSAYMEVILADVQVGECLTLDPTSTGYHQGLSSVLTYLLVWRLYLRIFKAASAEVRAKYANYLRQTDGVPGLMMNIFRLMPDPPMVGNAGSLNPKGPAPRSMFSTTPIMKAKGVSPSQREIQHQACALYYSILEDLPAMVRQWWTNQDKKVAPIVDRFTTKYASPLLCAQEVLDVQTATQTFENMTVKARSTTREVIATYTMQDLTMDLTVRIPANHPLGIITVDSEKKVGVGTTQWRNWTLQLTTFLRNQNGSIMDGLTLWKRNVDKRFEGVEDCMICFSVIHGSNCSLPKLQCKTCKKRYHSACLYKWFSTSNQSTCPLCRTPF